jgi:RNA polymerase sigma-70 factor (ECF subfamily)
MPSDVPFTELMARLREGDVQGAQAVVDRFARRLVGLAAARLPPVLSAKVDPENLVQSAFRSFFLRHADGRLDPENGDDLWTLLTVQTVRKCGHKVNYTRRGIT